MTRSGRPHTGWAVALVGVTLAAVAGVGYVAVGDRPELHASDGARLGLRGLQPEVPVPDKPRPAPMPEVNPIGPR